MRNPFEPRDAREVAKPFPQITGAFHLASVFKIFVMGKLRLDGTGLPEGILHRAARATTPPHS
jgi:hypothetical protein